MANSSPGEPKWRKLAPELRRQQLLDAAADIVVTDGVSAVTMDRIAQRAGVSNGQAYRFFANRTEVLRALLDRFWDELRDDLARAEIPAHASHVERARAEAWVYLQVFPRRHPAFLRLRYHSAGVEPAVDERIAERRDEVTKRRSLELVEEYGLPPGLAATAATMLIASLEEGARQHTVNGTPPEGIVELHVAFIEGLRQYARSQGGVRLNLGRDSTRRS
jgi:AcrR family transcriptional regulator